MSKIKILLIAGARPNFMKIAPLVHELRKDKYEVDWKLVHTGQHYDFGMSRVFFANLDIPEPDYFLNVGSGSHAQQTGKTMVEFEKICIAEGPDVVVVVGDVNSTLACSITAKKLGVKVAHVEAGLRSNDMSMPEEINRKVTDSISDYLFVTEKSGIKNLEREGKAREQILFVGNIMIDTLYYGLTKLDGLCVERRMDVSEYAVVTLHRPSNVDDKGTFKGILESLVTISKELHVFFPIHPRTKKSLERFHLTHLLKDSSVELMKPLSYMDFLALWRDALLVLTDSGGIQEETTALGIPCFTIRENTERPITIEEGTNTLVGTAKESILSAYWEFRSGKRKKGIVPDLWDGKASERIVDILLCSLKKV